MILSSTEKMLAKGFRIDIPLNESQFDTLEITKNINGNVSRYCGCHVRSMCEMELRSCRMELVWSPLLRTRL